MTIDSEIETWKPPKETSYKLNWADLTIIDLSSYDLAGGKIELAQKLKNAVQNDGFWAVVGTGISDDEVYRMFALGRHFFEHYSEEEKKVQEVNFADGNYFGYKIVGNKNFFGTDIKDNVETFNIAKFTRDGLYEDYFKQRFIKQYRDELEAFSRKSFEVVKKLLTLFAIILELEEDYFVRKHLYDDPSDDHLRFMKYHPRSQSDDAKVQNIWARAHTDFGSLTLLYNQMVSGLQIKLADGSWKYIPSVPGGIICNIGDTLSFWSGNYFNSTIHRVVRPPPDQVDSPRIGLFYFVRPGETEIEIAPSPLLKRLGLYRNVNPVKGTEYVRSRVKDYHDKKEYLKQENVKFRVGDFEIQDGFE